MAISHSKRILIINRGEVAIRIAKAVRELGFTSVGLWTNDEPNAFHLTYCDEWVHLKGETHLETYLNQEQLLKICSDHQIDGVHPGYGFLAENSTFAEKIIKAGVTWIGPHSEAISQLGDKATSKQIASAAGVPTIPGSKGRVEGVSEALSIAKEIGFPVLLKASAGGGGKGMRLCHSEEELENNFERVKSESLSSFGDDGLLVEKFILDPHHIEVQILADKKGNVFHLYERECSVQRRHQKITEEAPSPFIGDDEKLRTDICETAVKLASEVKYDSAGTVEFVMGADKKFYFLEMNTRIQVEHPITEEITGVDLVASMIEVAFGKELQFKGQEDITKQGHAIECRICAEDPVSMLPAPGKVESLVANFPQGTRFDHCLYPGYEVTPMFDPMVGKLITFGKTRDVSMRKMSDALSHLEIHGLKNNIPLHCEILKNEVFRGGNYSTHFLVQEKPQDKLLASTEEQLIENMIAFEAGRIL